LLHRAVLRSAAASHEVLSLASGFQLSTTGKERACNALLGVPCIAPNLKNSRYLSPGVSYSVQPERVFAEIYRVLKPGGVCIVTFSNRQFYDKVRPSLCMHQAHVCYLCAGLFSWRALYQWPSACAA
jgi:SAM-dependent methyltransferase